MSDRTLGGSVWVKKKSVGIGEVIFEAANGSVRLALDGKRWLDMGAPETIGMSYGTPEYFEVQPSIRKEDDNE